MKSIRFAALVLFAMLWAAPAFACENGPVALAYRGRLGHFKDSFLQTNIVAEGRVEFENNQSLGLIAVTFLIDYFDVKHERMFTLVYHAGVEKARSEREFFHRQFGLTVGDFKGSLSPGQSVEVLGRSPVTSTACPSSSEVTLVNAKFEDGTVSAWSIPDWHLDPDIASGPARIKLPASTALGDTEFLATAVIGRDGKLTDIVSADKAGMAVLSKLRYQLAALRFLPSVNGGRTVEGPITLLFRFHPKRETGPLRNLGFVQQEAPFSVLDIVSIPSSRDNWELIFANVQVPPT